MKFTWHEPKRQQNLKKHGLDFANAHKVLNGPILAFEDTREGYGEQRMISVGMLDYLVVLVVHVESADEIRIISMRKATHHETDQYYEYLGQTG
jgi:uncharacterized DUF497 family protein